MVEEVGGKMSGGRRKLDAALKAQIVFEAIRGKRTIVEIASEVYYPPFRPDTLLTKISCPAEAG